MLLAVALGLGLGDAVGARRDVEGPLLDEVAVRHVGVGLAQQALEVEDGVLGVRRQLVDGRVAHDHLLALEAHVGGRGTEALVVGDDVHLAVVPHAHAAVRRADVDACDHHVA